MRKIKQEFDKSFYFAPENEVRLPPDDVPVLLRQPARVLRRQRRVQEGPLPAGQEDAQDGGQRCWSWRCRKGCRRGESGGFRDVIQIEQEDEDGGGSNRGRRRGGRNEEGRERQGGKPDEEELAEQGRDKVR